MRPLNHIHRILIVATFGAVPIVSWGLPTLFESGLSDDSQQALTPSQARLRDGHAALQAGKLDAAAAAFNDAAKLDDRSSLPYVGLAEVARLQNQKELVESNLKKAVGIDPRSVTAQRAWARYLVAEKRFAEAEAALKKAIASEPRSTEAYVDLGGVYLQGMRRPKDAVAAYREAIKLRSNHEGAHLGLGSALATQGDLDAAIIEFEMAAKLAPKDPAPIQELARLYVVQKKYEKALALLNDALALQPGYMPARLERGDIFVSTGSLDKALTEYQEAVKVLPGLAVAHLKIGAIYQAQKKWSDAEKAFLKAIDADPKMFAAYNNLAWMSVERNEKLPEALVWAKKAVELSPDSGDSLDTLGWVLRARGDLDQAATTLEKAVGKQPKQALFYYHLGVVYAAKGQNKAAVTAFKNALAINKEFPEAADARIQLQKLGG